MSALTRPFQRRGPSGPLADPERGIVQVGYDQPIETLIIPPGVGKYPRDLAGNPLKVVLPDVTPGNVLEVDWSSTLINLLDVSYVTSGLFYALAFVTFDGSEPTIPSATTFGVVNSYAGSEFNNPDVSTSDVQSMRGLAAIRIPAGATIATVELFYVSDLDVEVTGTIQGTPPSSAGSLKVTELATQIVSQLGPGYPIPAT